MFNINQYVVYKKDVCLVKDIIKSRFNNEDYYVLVPLSDSSLKDYVPADNRCNNLRELASKEEVEKFINEIPNIKPIECNNKLMENDYKELLKKDSFENLIKIIKTTYLRNEERTNNNKKISDKDNNYFNQAEKYLYNEFSIALGMSYDDTKEYVINKVADLNEK